MEDRRYQRHPRWRSLVDPRHSLRIPERIDLMMSDTENQVRDSKAKNRFELDVQGKVAFANYRLTPGTVIITHTETPRELRGRGIASELVNGALQLIRADGLKVVAGCGFVVDYLNKHPEFADLVS